MSIGERIKAAYLVYREYCPFHKLWHWFNESILKRKTPE